MGFIIDIFLIFFILVVFSVITVFLVGFIFYKYFKMETDFGRGLSALNGFRATKKLIYSPGIAVDELGRKVCLMDTVGGKPRFRVYHYKDILACEVFDNGKSILKCVRESEIGDALLGGIRVSPAGGAIGDLTGKTGERYIYGTEYRYIYMETIVNDFREPVHGVLIPELVQWEDNTFPLSELEAARRWHYLLSEIMKQTDAQERKALPPDGKFLSAAVANELSKLIDLHERGWIVEEEFQHQKVELLTRQ